MMRRAGCRSAQDGYILVAVLGFMLILTGFMAAGSLLVRSTLDTAKVGDAELPMRGLAQGGLALTAYQLFIIKAAPADIDGRQITAGDGKITAHIHDEGGKADLNGSDPALLTAIFQSAGLDLRSTRDLLACVIEVRGADRVPSLTPISSESKPTSIGTSAQGGKPEVKTMTRGFLSLNQLRDCPDLTRSDWRALRPLLTVFNPDGKINIRSASAEVLAAIPGLSRADVEVILQRRDGPAKKDLEALLPTRADARAHLKSTFGPAFTVRIDAVSLKGRKKTINAVVAASKDRNAPYYILDWWE